ncbi:MAG: fused MFS/spermidine synthase [Gammaproteobacteria bacterium]|jgi:spermidine synthase
MKYMLFLIAAFVPFSGVAMAQSGRVIHHERSLYRNIVVTDEGDRICMAFTLHERIRNWQSCMDKRDPDRLLFHYARMVMSGLLLDSQPKRILIAGLGGASLPRVLHDLYPQARIDIAEIDPAVVRMAKKYFDFEEGGPVHVIVKDARVHVRRSLARGEHYDFIILDAFTGDYIPEHLMTLEFLEECRRLLADNGVLVANTFSSSKLYDSESVTYQKAFGWFLNMRQPGGNRVIITRRGAEVNVDDLRHRLADFKPDVAQFGVDMKHNLSLITLRPDWDPHAPVLTDQYAPVNLLNGR